MKIPHAGCLMGVALLLAGCATRPPPVQTRFDASAAFATFKTYALLPVGDETNGRELPSPDVVSAIREAVEAGLATAGLVPAPEGGADLLVDVYGEATQEPDHYWREDIRTTRGTVNVYYVDGRSVPGRRRGKLVIELIDRRSGRLVWRGSRTRTLGGRVTPELIRRTVNEILATYPPS